MRALANVSVRTDFGCLRITKVSSVQNIAAARKQFLRRESKIARSRESTNSRFPAAGLTRSDMNVSLPRTRVQLIVASDIAFLWCHIQTACEIVWNVGGKEKEAFPGVFHQG